MSFSVTLPDGSKKDFDKAVSVKELASSIATSLCHLFLTVFTGRMFPEIPQKEEAASDFLLCVRSWKITAARSGLPAVKESEPLCILF